MPLTIERAALVRRLVTQGYADDQIAHLLRISPATVGDIKHRATRDAAIRAASVGGRRARQIAQDFGMAVMTVKKIIQH
jgi:transposase